VVNVCVLCCRQREYPGISNSRGIKKLRKEVEKELEE
jgi:hypothetical protein